MKRRSVFPFIGTKKPKTTNVDLYLGGDPNKSWSDFIQCAEEVVSYMFLQLSGETDSFAKNYQKLLARKTVTVTMNAQQWADAQIVFIVSEGKNFRYLTDCMEETIEGDLGVRKGGNMVSKGRPVSTEDVEEPCLMLFKKLLIDLGYKPVDFGFDDDELSEWEQVVTPPRKKTKAQAPEQEAPTEVQTEAEMGGMTLDDMLEAIVVPLKVKIPENAKGLSVEERLEQGLVSLLEYLGYLGKEGRNEYIGNLTRFSNSINDYVKRVINMSSDLDGGQDGNTSQEEMIATMMKCGYTEEQIKAVLEQIGQPLKEDKPDQEPKKDEEEDDIFLPKPKADPEDTVLRPAQKYVDLLTERDDVSNKDIPKKLSAWARDGLSVTRLQVNAALKEANTRYISGGQQGKPVQFLASKPKGKK